LPVKKITKKFNYSKKDLIELVLKIDDYKNFYLGVLIQKF